MFGFFIGLLSHILNRFSENLFDNLQLLTSTMSVVAILCFSYGPRIGKNGNVPSFSVSYVECLEVLD